MYGTVVLITLISAFWFTVGYLACGRAMHCGRNNTPVVPPVQLRRTKDENGEAQPERPRPRIGV